MASARPCSGATRPTPASPRGIPWLPVPTSYQTHNVATEQKDPGSILNFYRDLIALRKTNPALLEGDWLALNPDDPNVLSYLRRYKDEAVIVVLNMSPNEQKVSFDLSKQRFAGAQLKTLLTSQTGGQTLPTMELGPYAVFIAEVVKK